MGRILSQCIHILNHHDVHLILSFVKYMSIKLEKKCPSTQKGLECSKNLQKANVAGEWFSDTVYRQNWQPAGEWDTERAGRGETREFSFTMILRSQVLMLGGCHWLKWKSQQEEQVEVAFGHSESCFWHVKFEIPGKQLTWDIKEVLGCCFCC